MNRSRSTEGPTTPDLESAMNGDVRSRDRATFVSDKIIDLTPVTPASLNEPVDQDCGTDPMPGRTADADVVTAVGPRIVAETGSTLEEANCCR